MRAAWMSETIKYKPWPEPGTAGGDVLAEDDRAPGAGRGELDHAEVFTVVVVGVEPPSELRVELLGPLDIPNRDDDDLELHVGWSDAVSIPRTAFVLIAAS